MKVALGAWGLGAIAASHSSTWNFRFGQRGTFNISVPPMSSVHAGLIEPFPLILCEKVFVDSNQYSVLTDSSSHTAIHSIGYMSTPATGALLREFQRAGVIELVDYRSIVMANISDISAAVEKVLDDPELPEVATASRQMWTRFLMSPGGVAIPTRELELSVRATDVSDYEGRVRVSDLVKNSSLNGRTTLPLAALLCGHDVFDVMTMLVIGRALNATVCDWQMYGPIYLLCMRHVDGFCRLRSPPNGECDEVNWYVPIPRSVDIEDIWRMRESPYVSYLRNSPSHASVASKLGDAKSLLELRRRVQNQLINPVLNTYAAIGTTERSGRDVFVERPRKGASVVEGMLLKDVAAALMSAYPRRKSLEAMLRYRLDVNLEVISAGSNLSDAVFDLVVAAEAEGWISQLVDAAIEDVPNNHAIIGLVKTRSKWP